MDNEIKKHHTTEREREEKKNRIKMRWFIIYFFYIGAITAKHFECVCKIWVCKCFVNLYNIMPMEINIYTAMIENDGCVNLCTLYVGVLCSSPNFFQ